MVLMFQKRVVKQAFGGELGNSEIVAIIKQEKNTPDDSTDSSDP